MLRHITPLCCIIFVIIGVILTSTYFINFSTVKSILDIYAVDKVANTFTVDVFELIKIRLYIIGTTIIIIGIWLIVFQHWLYPDKKTESSFPPIIKKIKELFVRSFQEENQPYTLALIIIIL